MILGILGNPEMHLDCPVYPELYIRITVRFLDVAILYLMLIVNDFSVLEKTLCLHKFYINMMILQLNIAGYKFLSEE